MNTAQMDFWKGQFGKDYTERNTLTIEELNQDSLDKYGFSREEMNARFLGGIDVNNILEVGCNVGLQLQQLQKSGYNNLFGIELQSYAVEKAKQISTQINIIQGSAFDIPFKDNYFDLTFTSGVLIHIAPEDINQALDEIYRVSKRYIWGFEYYSEVDQQLEYRGYEQKMWKMDYMKVYLNRFPNLSVVKVENYKYKNSNNMDQMFLLEKLN
ncbi:pseudaminic acid biosynthesis-associated methylase [Paenibacillus ferrarius]|uniref:pseudaminic acid biosynthesis-associated methylase n=1 Tax=Paenibacillus ferrarius TaxID=1469647 RepID=UPI003D2D22DB